MMSKLSDARSLAVLFHRWAGLGLVAFLLLEGLTGSLLAFDAALDRACWPVLAPVAAGARRQAPLTPAGLGRVVRASLAGAIAPVSWPGAPAAGASPNRAPVVFTLAPNAAAADAPHPAPGDVEVAVDPYTGREIGRRRWGDLGEGRHNLMPFVHRLHRSLALGPVGSAFLGIVAIVWTLDCFVGAWLTLPKGRPLLAKWKPVWCVQRKRLNLDLHRAGGLWLWGVLLVFAWSSVGFELPTVQAGLMRLLAVPFGGPVGDPLTGDPVSRWLAALHTARVGGAAMRVVVCALGFAVSGLAATGVVIWWRKRRGRLAAARAAAARRGAATPALPAVRVVARQVPALAVRRQRPEHRPSPAATPALAERPRPNNRGYADSSPPWPPTPPTPRTKTSPRHSAS